MAKHKISSKAIMVVLFAAGTLMGFLAGRFDFTNAANPNSAGAVVMPTLAGAGAVDYINNNLLQEPGVSAELKNVSEVGGIYALSIDIKKGGSIVQSTEVYATRDGQRLLLGNLVDITKKQEPKAPPQETAPKSDAPDVKMFVMAFCPYGKQAENGIGPAARLLGVDVEPHFVIYPNYRGGGPDFCMESGKYCSMHGVAELNEGIRQLCIYRDSKEKWWAYVDYVNSKCSLQNIESCWKDAATSVGIGVSDVESCQMNDGASLAKAEFELNQKYGVQGSPTILINGQQYGGGRSPDNFKGALCSAFANPPAGCSQKLDGAAQAATASCS